MHRKNSPQATKLFQGPLESRLAVKNIETAVGFFFIIVRHFLGLLKFIYSEKATIFCEIFTVDLSYVVMVKSTVEISQNFVAFSDYMNFR